MEFSKNGNVYSNRKTNRKPQVDFVWMADTPKVKYYRVAVVILGLLSVVLLAVIIWMVIRHKAETDQRDQLQIKKNLVDRENHQLRALNKNLATETNNLTDRNRNLTVENSRLIKTSFTDHNQWRCFGSSLYYISTGLKNWHASKQLCLDHGGHLVIIDSEEEQKFILGLKKTVWIGLNDIETEGTWEWVNGQILNNSKYWMKGEPNDLDNEDCAEIIHDGSVSDSWNDSSCDREKNFICERAF